MNPGKTVGTGAHTVRMAKFEYADDAALIDEDAGHAMLEDQQSVCLIQDNFLTQQVLEPTKAARVLNIMLSSLQ